MALQKITSQILWSKWDCSWIRTGFRFRCVSHPETPTNRPPCFPWKKNWFACSVTKRTNSFTVPMPGLVPITSAATMRWAAELSSLRSPSRNFPTNSKRLFSMISNTNFFPMRLPFPLKPWSSLIKRIQRIWPCTGTQPTKWSMRTRSWMLVFPKKRSLRTAKKEM